jgi:hypothetical protein
MEELNDDRPVTFRLVAAVVACLLVQAPVAIWAGTLQANVSDMRANGTEPSRRLESRVSAIERELQLRGAQMDRIEADVKELLRRTR